MKDDELKKLSYEQKEQRLDEILGRLDRSETPMDELAAEAKEAAQLIMSMQATLKSTKTEIAQVFAEMEKQRDGLAAPNPSSGD